MAKSLEDLLKKEQARLKKIQERKQQRDDQAMFKTRARDAIAGYLFQGTTKRLNTELANIIKRNSDMCGNNQCCLLFRGRVLESAKHKRYPSPINLIQKALLPEIQEWMKNFEHHERAANQTKNSVMAVLNKTASVDDLIELMPSQIHDLLRNMAANGKLHHGSEMDAGEIAMFKTEHDGTLNFLRARLNYNLVAQL